MDFDDESCTTYFVAGADGCDDDSVLSAFSRANVILRCLVAPQYQSASLRLTIFLHAVPALVRRILGAIGSAEMGVRRFQVSFCPYLFLM